MSNAYSVETVRRIALEAFQAQYPTLSGSLGGLVTSLPNLVVRLDRPGTYFLIGISDSAGLRGIVQLDGLSLAVESTAIIRDPQSSFLLSEQEALQTVKAAFPQKSGWHDAFLGWRPCRESFDSMRPLWVLPYSDGEVYVTQNREGVEQLTIGRGG
ncbi:MAG: hypothetical protein JNK38_25340 [Acidobacteria bacterium]|nr:hypothetical protein [Acidobacteriota bacterium]